MNIAEELHRISRLRATALQAAQSGDRLAASALLDAAIDAIDQAQQLESGARPPSQEHTHLVALYARTLLDQAWLLAELGEWDRARRCLELAAEPVAGLGLPDLGARDAEVRAAVEMLFGDTIAALGWAERAVELAVEVGPRASATALVNLAIPCTVLGQHQRAAELLRRAAVDAERAQAPDLVGQVLANQSAVALRSGDTEAAQRLAEAALAAGVDEETGAQVALTVGHLAAEAGDRHRADAHFRDSLRLARALGSPSAQATAHLAIGHYAQDDAAALDHFDRARDLLADAPIQRAVADYLQAVWMVSRAFRRDELEWVQAAADLVLPAALVIDAARIGLDTDPLRTAWFNSAESNAVNVALDQLWRLGAADLLVAVLGHLAATAVPRRDAEVLGTGLPPVVTDSEGRDPLASVAAATVRRYGVAVRDTPDPGDAAPRDREPQRVTVELMAVRRADLYLWWRFGDEAAMVARIDGPVVDEALATWAGLIPGSSTAGAGLGLWGGLADREAERAGAAAVGAALLPAAFRERLAAMVSAAGERPLLRIRAGGDLGVLAWEWLAVDGPAGDTRLVEVADVVMVAPAGVRHRSDVTPSTATADGAAVLVLDPRVPGFSATSPLGSVLGRPERTGPLLDRLTQHLQEGTVNPAPSRAAELLRRTDTDRSWLHRALDGAGRLLYVGHVSQIAYIDGHEPTAGLHLTCTADTDGLATPIGRHRPLGARDLLAPGPGGRRWSFPPRVALVACASGVDAHQRDGFGLAYAALRQGARQVVATRWPMATGQAYADAGLDVATDSDPLIGLVLAVDAAQVAADPAAALATWQRSQLERWRRTGDLAASAALWAGVQTIVAQ